MNILNLIRPKVKDSQTNSIKDICHNVPPAPSDSSSDSNRDFCLNVISAVKNNDIRNAVRLLEVKTTNRRLAIPYTKEAISNDMANIREWMRATSPSEHEIDSAILVTMLHYPLRTTLKFLKELGHNDVTLDQLTYINTYIATLNNLKELRDAGIIKYKISTSKDTRVCPACSNHEGEIHFVAKACIGKNAPPFCDKCRCLILPVFPKHK